MLKRNQVFAMVLCFLLGSVFTLLLGGLLSSHFDGSVNFRGWHHVLFPDSAQSAGRPTVLPPAGLLEAIELPLANTAGRLADATDRLQPTRWHFEGFTVRRTSQFLLSCGFSRFQIRILLDKPYCTVTENGCEIAPPESVIWRLSKENRQRLYSLLAKSPKNYPQRFPFYFSPGTIEGRLYLSGLSRREIQAVTRLTYTNYLGMECFSDLQCVQGGLSSNGFNNLVGALYQNPSFILRLRVTPESNVDQLTRYWGRGGREKLIEPLLKALRRVPGGGVINVSALLPPFARLRLFTYPDAWADPTAARQDCIFTSLNFFNEQPDTNFLDADYVQKVVNSEYETLHLAEPALGDLISLVDEKSEQAVHMCVYVAEGFVFTKNGTNPEQPWVLMRLTDVLKIYTGYYHTDKVVILRHKTSENFSSGPRSQLGEVSGLF